MRISQESGVRAQPWHCVLAALVLLLAPCCGGGGGGSGGGGSLSADPVDRIINAANRASHSTHWHLNLGSTLGTSDWSFWADGTGAYRQGTNAANGRLFTWTKLGPDSLLISGLDGVPGVAQTWSAILGSISLGVFDVELDDNPTVRTLTLRSGAIISPTPPSAGTLYVSFPTQTGVAMADAATLGQIGSIFGGNTGFSIPSGLAVHTGRGELFVASSGAHSVVVHPTSARGNVAPIRTIQGGATGLAMGKIVSGIGVAFDGIEVDETNGEIFVVNSAAVPPSITVYGVTDDGNVAPRRTIQGANTTLAHPVDIAVNAQHGEIYVTDSDPFGRRLLTFSRTAVGNVAPIRTVDVGGVYVAGVDVDPAAGEIWLCGSTGGSTGGALYVYARTAVGTQPPLRVLSSNLRHLGLDIEPTRGELSMIRFTFAGMRLEVWDTATGTAIQDTDAADALDVARGP